MNILLPIFIFAGLGIGTGVLLSVCSKVFAVKTDTRVTKLTNVLPGLNCGACGFSSCENYAEHLIQDDTLQTNRCTPGGEESAKAISKLLGTTFEKVKPIVAQVYCHGTIDHTSDVFEYQGEKSCSACNLYYSGNGKCKYGCLGLGDCKLVCKFDAIKIENGIASIDEERCTGCSMCANVCPKGIIGLHPKEQEVHVGCLNSDVARHTIKACTVGCIGCKKCQKVCQYDAIHVDNNRASIDYDRCTNCKECVAVCPVNCIVSK